MLFSSTIQPFDKKTNLNRKHLSMSNQNADPDLMAAVQNLNCIEIFYNDELHVIEPICYGINILGDEIILGLQILPTLEEKKIGLQRYILKKAFDCNVLAEKFKPRPIANTFYKYEFFKVFAVIDKY